MAPSSDPSSEKRRVLHLQQDVLGKNNQIAQHNREYFEDNAILALNLVSSPGSGKTSTLEKSIVALAGIPLAVIEGDQQTTRDAQRISNTGAPVIQVNTGTGCHLDADMVHKAVHQLDLQENSILFIENVGNLVCPAMFDLGEAFKVVVISVTEGDDKPLKYPTMFHAADICLINKVDLLPYVDFDVDRCKEYARQVNHALIFFEISATTGQGMKSWVDWLKAKVDTSTR
jgi:hydrogenase nickel incorporation protein HypB